MNRVINIHGINFEVVNRMPRKNQFERGQKYGLFVDNIPTSATFSTIKSALKWVNENWFIYA